MGTRVKYYKRIASGDSFPEIDEGVIYPDHYIFTPDVESYNTVKKSVKNYPENWKQVTLSDYIEQEGGWYIRGSEEFREFLDQNNIDKNGWIGDYSSLFYTIKNGKVYGAEKNGGVEININQLKELYDMNEENTFSSNHNDKIIVEVNSPFLSEAIQKVALENGYKWTACNKREVQYTDKLKLDFRLDGKGIYYCRLQKTTHHLPDDWDDVVELLSEKQPITIGHYEVQFGDHDVTVGCQTYSNELVENLAKTLDILNNFEYLVIDGQKVTKEKMEEIYEKLAESKRKV